ncbi:Crp/Fnr family transcriptional regulator [Ornithinibacillus sp. 179-J 7C1 HS]|uniref:Crp/Fnr family transcriptional regulator n=1 Tax=Ornithinibacillus sp. 179-J 7C1 HS TaxID=3142384 RepID=UPI0039A2DC56
MKDKLLQYMAKYTNLNEDDQKAILEEIAVETFSKGTNLAKQGYPINPTKCYFVLSGCIRQYRIDSNGKEVTTNFYTEEQPILLSNLLELDHTSKYSLTCVEDAVLVVGDIESEEDMYEQYSELEKMTRRMMEIYLGEAQNDLTQFISSTPEERYKSIIQKRPNLVNRVPQHQLASYLGMTPESLSRIKKRIHENNADKSTPS